MRNDMSRVVTESPRGGHGNRSQKFGGRLSKDDIDRERDDDQMAGGLIAWSRRRNKNHKEFSDLLGPLHGYLRKQVGRPWNAVWSELSQHLDKRSLTGRHIFSHIDWEVEREVYEDRTGKRPVVRVIRNVSINGTKNRHGRPSGFYVHPRTGLLCWNQPKAFQWGHKLAMVKRLNQTFPDLALAWNADVRPYRAVDDCTLLVFQHDVWFVRTYAVRDTDEIVRRVMQKDGTLLAQTRRMLQMPLKELVSTRQLGKRLLKRYAALIQAEPS